MRDTLHRFVDRKNYELKDHLGKVRADVREVSSASQVKSDEHLSVIVDDATGKSAKGGAASGWAKYGAKTSYIEKSDANPESVVHELGHNFYLEHVFEETDDLDDTFEGDGNHMDYSSKTDHFSDKQVTRIRQNISNLNKGKTTKTLSKDDHSYSNTTEKKPYSSGSKGEVVPATISESGQ